MKWAEDPKSKTRWPFDVDDPDLDGVEWQLRYGTPTKSDLLAAASVMQAYAFLATSPRESFSNFRRAYATLAKRGAS